MASGGGGPGRADSAPPTQFQRPPENKPSPAPSVASAATAPPKAGKGPATFEDMGIPQGKQEGDCVSQALIEYLIMNCMTNSTTGCHVNAQSVHLEIWVAWLIRDLSTFLCEGVEHGANVVLLELSYNEMHLSRALEAYTSKLSWMLGIDIHSVVHEGMLCMYGLYRRLLWTGLNET